MRFSHLELPSPSSGAVPDRCPSLPANSSCVLQLGESAVAEITCSTAVVILPSTPLPHQTAMLTHHPTVRYAKLLPQSFHFLLFFFSTNVWVEGSQDRNSVIYAAKMYSKLMKTLRQMVVVVVVGGLQRSPKVLSFFF